METHDSSAAPNDRGLAKDLAQRWEAPGDHPRLVAIMSKVASVVHCLGLRIPDIECVSVRFEVAARGAVEFESPGAAFNGLSKRRGKHLFYSLLSEMSSRSDENEAFDQQALRTLAAWTLRAAISGWLPDAAPIAKIRAVLLRPTGTIARSWSARGRRRCHDAAVSTLQECIARNPASARAIGFQVTDEQPKSALSSIEHFNVLFRKRMNALQTSSERRAVAGAGGHGTLSREGLLEAGRELLNGSLAGDKGSLFHYLQVVSHLSEQLVALLPLVYRGDDTTSMLAWLDVDASCYCYVLVRLVDHGAKGTGYLSDLFEDSEQVVRVNLSPVAAAMLRQLRAARKDQPRDVEALLGPSPVSARSAVVGSHAYRRTARRLQESLPVHLMATGGNRWPILLATSSPFLASIGRFSYGCCPLQLVQREFDRAHELMGWPASTAPSAGTLIGSRTVPRAESIMSLEHWLREHADRRWAGLKTHRAVVDSLRATAPWMSFIVAIELALRQRLEYRLPYAAMRDGVEVMFDDKNAHELEPHPVPISQFLGVVTHAYMQMLGDAVAALRRFETPDAVVLALQLEAAQANGSRVLILDIDAVGRAFPAGYRTWHDVAPTVLRLPGNFARQFWPLRTLMCQLPQRLLDVLMRHQLANIHLRGENAAQIKGRAREQLRKTIDQITFELKVRLPACLENYA